MDLDLVFIGTAGAVPTPQRALSALLIRYGGTRILIDCGEGTQRQLMRSTGLSELDLICLTHFHGDHVLGLPGMLKTFAMRERELPLTIAGPVGLRRLFTDLQPLIGRLPYELDLIEIQPGDALDIDDVAQIQAIATQHTTRSAGWALIEHDRPGRFDVDTALQLGVDAGPDFGRLQRGETVDGRDGPVTPEMVLGTGRPGRKIVVTGDTRPTAAIVAAAQDADVLVHEATFLDGESARAADTGHTTARGAALTAAAANVSLLAITHISNRYFGGELCEEARSVFAKTECPRDFDAITVPFAERGEPELVPRGGKRPRRKPNAAAPV